MSYLTDMKIYSILYTFPALLAASVAHADISLGKPGVQVSQSQAYHSDLLASNAVRAAFREIRSIPVVKLDAEPTTEEVAVFEVKQNLAHRRYDRMGDGMMQPGKLFSVSLAADVPGQDAAVGSKIREMSPGDEALMNIDHIYLFREEGNENVRSCTRFARVQPQPSAPAQPSDSHSAPAQLPQQQAAADTQPLPLNPRMSGSARSVESRITIAPDAQGVMRRTKIEIHREWSSETGAEKVRKFINDVEVDPQTDRPLTLSGAQDAPAAAPSEPAPPQPQEVAPPTAPAQPADAPAPIPNPADAPEFGF